ncbi:efflux RND transporter periplasmic adaptor subunit [Pseudomarimonas salicorniae]|uniref:Efflux RND transporter periplasmic adaptor subunit n=1 Tax=Pseudomarimonas salicorniae TaxID=2933270 RepID=A0ABT0GIX4_9GAMM|nr:efflux RND transporter periplasmic adaptor subunit [Lysobacter sp. CAU 1642]MCK7594302.1 efflux RND transporter periplasmic adaptor subunit [Lysobacter sp. CAU 1642]
MYRPLLSGLALLAIASLPLQAQSPPPPAVVSVASAELRAVAPLLWTPASAVSRQDARIAAEASGRLVSLAEIGDAVEAGAVLARVDDTALKLAVAEAVAARDRLVARLEYVRSQRERLSQLAAQGTVSRAQAEEQAAEQHMLEREREGAEVAVRQARHRLSLATVRAPFAGTVVERLAAEGEFLSPGLPLLRLVDTAGVELQARAPVSLSALLGQGDAVDVRQGETRLRGTVRAVVPVGDAASRQFELRVALDGPAPLIGSAMEVGLPRAAASDQLAVPQDAVVLRPGERYVVRVSAENTAERVPVELGATVDQWVSVSGELKAGDRLVVRGAERVRPGQALQIQNEAALAGLGGDGAVGGSR